MSPRARRRRLHPSGTASPGALLVVILALTSPALGQDGSGPTAPEPPGKAVAQDASGLPPPPVKTAPSTLAAPPPATPPKVPPDAAPPTRALWLQPLSMGFFGLYLDDRGLLLPLGVNWPVGPHADLVAETSVGTGLPAVCGRSAVTFWGSLGVAFGAEKGPLNGGFIQPKALFRYTRSAEASCPADDGGLYAAESEASVGVDFGVQHTAGAFYVALVMGMHAGYCWNCPSRSLFSFGPLSVDPPRTSGIKVGFNPNFLRMGYAF